MNKQVQELFDYCYNSLSDGKYTVKGKKKLSPQNPLSEEQLIDETINSLLYLAAKKNDDKRFIKIYDYILVPKGPKKIQHLIESLSYLDIMNFISPGSEGFPEI